MKVPRIILTCALACLLILGIGFVVWKIKEQKQWLPDGTSLRIVMVECDGTLRVPAIPNSKKVLGIDLPQNVFDVFRQRSFSFMSNNVSQSEPGHRLMVVLSDDGVRAPATTTFGTFDTERIALLVDSTGREHGGLDRPLPTLTLTGSPARFVICSVPLDEDVGKHIKIRICKKDAGTNLTTLAEFKIRNPLLDKK